MPYRIFYIIRNLKLRDTIGGEALSVCDLVGPKNYIGLSASWA
jgi:hypothetical protein